MKQHSGLFCVILPSELQNQPKSTVQAGAGEQRRLSLPQHQLGASQPHLSPGKQTGPGGPCGSQRTRALPPSVGGGWTQLSPGGNLKAGGPIQARLERVQPLRRIKTESAAHLMPCKHMHSWRVRLVSGAAGKMEKQKRDQDSSPAHLTNWVMGSS